MRQTRNTSSILAAAALYGCVAAAPGVAQVQVAGALGMHDPSSVIKDGSMYFLYGTGGGIHNKWSFDGVTWNDERTGVFTEAPAWTVQAVPGFLGHFWAPDIAYFGGKYHLYYSASSWGTNDSVIGVTTSTTLNRSSPNYGWTDGGKVVQTDAWNNTSPETDSTLYNAIDPSILVDDDKVWMAWGSYSGGIVVSEINPSTGKPFDSKAMTMVAGNRPRGSGLEGAALIKRGEHYYLMVNDGVCCSGVDSTYQMRVGRSTSATGPFFDKNGVDMRDGGGTIFLDDDGKFVGPGHFARFVDTDGTDYYGMHYYDADFNGGPTYNKRQLFWTADAWPSAFAVNPDWRGSASDAWGAGANWSNGAIPNGVGHVANFGNLSATRSSIRLDGSGRTLGKVNFFGTGNFTIASTGHVLTLDADAGEGSATINANAGHHTIAAPINAVDWLGVNVTSGARVNLGNLTAKGMTKYGHGTLALNGTTTFSEPVLGKRGSIEVNGAVTANAFASMGQGASEGTTLVVRGAGSFTANSDLNIGDTGNAVDAASGWLEIHDNADVTVSPTGGLFVGSGFVANTRANGTVTQTGGTLAVNNTANGAFIIGGRNSSLAAGAYNLSGGTVNANGGVQVGGLGTGTLTVSGSGQFNCAAPLRMGSAATGAGTVHLNGGTLTTPQITEGAGTATFNFNGGTLRASGDNAAFMQSLGSANVDAGGAVIDTQGFTVAVAQPLLHKMGLGTALDGGLTKIGTGVLALSGNHSYTGGTKVRAGTLRVGPGTLGVSTPAGGPDVNIEVAPSSTDTAALNVLGGATVSTDRMIIAGNGANNTGGTATLNQSGGTINSSLWFAVGSVGSGTFNMSGGTLNQNQSGGTQLEVAVFGSGNSTATFGGSSQVNILNNGNFAVGVVNNSGSGTVNHDGGDVTFYGDAGATPGGSGNVVLGQHGPTGTYTYNLNGGTLTTGSVTRNATAVTSGATAILNFDGGTLRAARDGADLVNNLTAARVKAGGAVVDTNGHAVSLSQALLHDPSSGATPDGGLTKRGTGTLTLTGVNTYTGGTNVQAGTLRVKRLHANNPVNIAGGKLQVMDSSPTLPAHPSGDNAFVSRPSALAIANNGAAIGSRTYGGQLDLGNNDLVLDYDGASPLGEIEDMVRAGHNGGDWLGNGITSSTANANRNFALGVADNARLTIPFNAGRPFSGQAVDPTTIVVKFTHRIDLDLDGVITTNDATIFNSNYSEGAPAFWSIGDLDYDRVFTSNDATLFNSFYSEALGSVPDPTSVGVLALAGVGATGRRRQRA